MKISSGATVYISPHPTKVGVRRTLCALLEILAQHQAVVLLPQEMRHLTDNPAVEWVESEVGAHRADFIITLGGDGTLLRMAGLSARAKKPMFGINLGHLGFMTALERTELDLVHRVFTDDCEVDNRMMLQVQVCRGEDIVYAQTALNDVVITKRNPFRAIHVNVRADATSVMRFQGDGVIVATPTGTTAYSHSCGGPIIEPTAENIAVTPLAPFALGVSTIVFAPNRTITVQATGSDGEHACIAADSTEGFELLPDDRICIQRANSYVQLLKIKDRSFYEILKEKYTDGGEHK